MPQVVFDISATEPPATQAADWVQLSRDACLNAMFSVAELTQDNFPMCQGCWTTRIGTMRSELDAQSAALQHVVAVSNPSASDVAVALLASTAQQIVDHNIMAASPEEVAMIDAARRELDALKAQEAALDAELAALAKAEDEVAGRVNDYLAFQFLQGEETDRRIAERRRLMAQANTLSLTTAARELFRIDVTGPVGTVNGLRIGRLPSAQTPPTEINQACGYLLQALQLLVRRHDPGGLNHKLIPNGDASTIEVLRPKKEVQDFYITQKFFSWKTFGPAWVSFATVLGQVVAALKRDMLALQARLTPLVAEGAPTAAALKETWGRVRDVVEFTPLAFTPDGKVGGQSVKYGEAPDPVWTSAVKNVLIMVRWCFDADDVLADSSAADAPPPPAKPTFQTTGSGSPNQVGFSDLIRRDHQAPLGAPPTPSSTREADFGEQ